MGTLKNYGIVGYTGPRTHAICVLLILLVEIVHECAKILREYESKHFAA